MIIKSYYHESKIKMTTSYHLSRTILPSSSVTFLAANISSCSGDTIDICLHETARVRICYLDTTWKLNAYNLQSIEHKAHLLFVNNILCKLFTIHWISAVECLTCLPFPQRQRKVKGIWYLCLCSWQRTCVLRLHDSLLSTLFFSPYDNTRWGTTPYTAEIWPAMWNII